MSPDAEIAGLGHDIIGGASSTGEMCSLSELRCGEVEIPTLLA